MEGAWPVLGVTAALFGLCCLLIWAFRSLPREEWQIVAAVPRKKEPSGSWSGVNLTFYGFFTANAYLLAAALFLILSCSAGVSLGRALLLLTLLLGLCVPASRLIALRVDKTKSGFTVAGAAFVGLLALPAAIWLLNVTGDQTGYRAPFAATVAAAAIAYCLGEGVGRLACISFGCCYGKPLAEAGPWAARIFRDYHFVFHGRNKKIAYAASLEGVKVIPVQALTAVLYSLTSIAGGCLFFASRYAEAFLVVACVSQIWRAYSEILRADYRGEGKITAYQTMALAAVPIAVCIAYALPAENSAGPDIALGLAAVWNPLALLLLQAGWIAIFLFTGVSDTTGSAMSFHVKPLFKNDAAPPFTTQGR